MPDSLFGGYYYIKVAARCVINGVQLPISSITLSYGMNIIPDAKLELPIGRVADGKAFNSISNAMQFLLGLAPFSTVQVFATFTSSPGGRASPSGDAGFPDGTEFPIFEGFVKLPSSSITFGSASIRIDCMGKSAALAGSTQFIRGASMAQPTNGGADAISFFGGGIQATLAAAIHESVGTSQAPSLWTGLLKILFSEVLDGTRSFSRPRTGEAALNNFAAQAIDRINIAKALPFGGVVIDASGVPDNLLAKSIIDTALGTFFDAWSGSLDGNLWRATMELSRLFGFKYVTAIEEDGILPVFFGLGGEAWRTINPNEYESIDGLSLGSETFYSYVTNVGVYSNAFSTSPWQGSAAPMPIVGEAGLASNSLAGTGQLLLVPAPMWLLPAAAPGQTTVQPGGAVPDASNPGTITVTDDQGKNETLYFSRGLGDNYAKTILYDQLFSHRRMGISGRVRFDIAPGSLLKIITAGERFTGEQSELWGHVAGVIIEIKMTDGAHGHACTKFALTNIRTKAEHAAFTLAQHPVFAQAWRGGKLSSRF